MSRSILLSALWLESSSSMMQRATSFLSSINKFNDTEYSNDVTVFNVTKDSGKSMWDLIKGVLDIVGGVFSETGDAVDGMNTALSEPEDDTSVWYIFDVPYEYMSPVGEGD